MPGIWRKNDFKRLREMCGVEPYTDFVETGTWKGQTVQAALDSGEFVNVSSIELDYDLWVYNHDRFFGLANIYRGDSGKLLEYILPKKRCFIFLDAHWWDELKSPATELPLSLELIQVLKRPYDDFLIVDDLQAFGGVDDRTVKEDWREITIERLTTFFKEKLDKYYIDQGRLILPLRMRNIAKEMVCPDVH